MFVYFFFLHFCLLILFFEYTRLKYFRLIMTFSFYKVAGPPWVFQVPPNMEIPIGLRPPCSFRAESHSPKDINQGQRRQLLITAVPNQRQLQPRTERRNENRTENFSSQLTPMSREGSCAAQLTGSPQVGSPRSSSHTPSDPLLNPDLDLSDFKRWNPSR